MLYVVGGQKVIPVQIQEINQKTTIEGVETHFMVFNSEGEGPYNLSSIQGKVFAKPSDVSSFLKENAHKAIESMVSVASQKAKASFGSVENSIFGQPEQKQQKPQEAKKKITEQVSPAPQVKMRAPALQGMDDLGDIAYDQSLNEAKPLEEKKHLSEVKKAKVG